MVTWRAPGRANKQSCANLIFFSRLWIDVLTSNNKFSFSAGLWRKRDEEQMRRFWRMICWSFCAGGQSWPNPQAIRLDLSSDANMASIISYYGRPSLMRNFITIFGNNKTMFWPDRGCHIYYIWGPDSGVVWLIGWPNSQSETCRTSASWPNQNLLAKRWHGVWCTTAKVAWLV